MRGRKNVCGFEDKRNRNMKWTAWAFGDRSTLWLTKRVFEVQTT